MLFSIEIVYLVHAAIPPDHGYIFVFVELKGISPVCEATPDILFIGRFRCMKVGSVDMCVINCFVTGGAGLAACEFAVLYRWGGCSDKQESHHANSAYDP